MQFDLRALLVVAALTSGGAATAGPANDKIPADRAEAVPSEFDQPPRRSGRRLGAI